MTSVTQGIASALASKPTTEACPNSNNVSGVSASVMTHCSRSPEASINASWRTRDAAPAPGSARSSRAGPGSAANSTPTATKLSQKPACSKAQGSIVTTTAQASSQTEGQGQRRPDSRNKPTVASIQTVRCAGTPQPLNSA